jgi:hypothetical protein
MEKSRAEYFEDLFRSGQTLQEIGDAYGLCRERVRQILKKRGVSAKDGGSYIRARQPAKADIQKEDRRRARFYLTYGCHPESVEGATADQRRSYRRQKYNARSRGVGFELSFSEWLQIWQDSGHLASRARGIGYVMARKEDKGPYAVGNVYICTQSQNIKDSFVFKPANKRKRRFCAVLTTDKQLA